MEDFCFYTSFAVVFLFFAFKLLLPRRGNHGLNLPPSPLALPIIGHLHLLKLPFHRFLQSLSEKYGPVFSLRLGSRFVVVVSSPSAVEECFSKNDVVLADRPHFLIGKYIGYNYSTLDALPYGDEWRNLRRLCSVEIFSSNRLNMFQSVRRDEAKLLLRRLSQDSMDKFAKVDLKSMFSKLSFNSLTRMISGKGLHGEEAGMKEVEQFGEIISEIFSLAGASNPIDYLPMLEWIDYGGFKKKLMKLSRQQEAMFQCLIDERRNKSRRSVEDNSSTTIDHLLALQKSDPDYYTDEIIKGIMLVLILAGSESSLITLEWAMALLLNHPNALNKVKEEIDIHIGQQRLMEELDLPKLGYLQNVIFETLRFFPPGPLLLPHMASNHCQVEGFDIPFGQGSRACRGISLANRVMGLTLGLLIQCFECRRVGEKEIDTKEGLGLTIPKAIPLEAMCKTREIIKLVV